MRSLRYWAGDITKGLGLQSIVEIIMGVWPTAISGRRTSTRVSACGIKF